MEKNEPTPAIKDSKEISTILEQFDLLGDDPSKNEQIFEQITIINKLLKENLYENQLIFEKKLLKSNLELKELFYTENQFIVATLLKSLKFGTLFSFIINTILTIVLLFVLYDIIF